jgi:hypothetical protein
MVELVLNQSMLIEGMATQKWEGAGKKPCALGASLRVCSKNASPLATQITREDKRLKREEAEMTLFLPD